jgi:hypothetical protein
MPVQKNFFVVFESNADALGRIRDPNLITKIVSVYGQAKGLNDALNFNHARSQVWANLDVARKGADAAPSDQLTSSESSASLGLVSTADWEFSWRTPNSSVRKSRLTWRAKQNHKLINVDVG